MRKKILLLGIILLIFSSCNPKYQLNSSSMLPNYQIGEEVPIIKANDLAYGDVILYYQYLPPYRETAFHRIVGLPGDTIRINNQQCIINGKKCNWEFIRRFLYETDQLELEEYKEELPNGKIINIYKSVLPLDSATATTSSIVVPPDSYFVIGDYRDGSVDSRWKGCVVRDSIIGKSNK